MAKLHKRKSARSILLEKKRQRKKRLKIFLGSFVVFFILFLGIVAYVTRLDFFNLQAIVVKNYHSPSLIRALVWNSLDGGIFIPNTFLLKINEDKIKNEILNKISDVDDVSVVLDIKNAKLTIIFKEREPVFYFCKDSDCKFYHLIDKNGFIYKKTNKKPNALQLIILDLENLKSKKIFDKEKYTESLFKYFSNFKQIQDYYLHKIKLNINDKVAILFYKNINDTFYMYIDLRDNIDFIKKKVEVFSEQTLLRDVIYFDTRFGNKIYYMLKQKDENAKE